MDVLFYPYFNGLKIVKVYNKNFYSDGESCGIYLSDSFANTLTIKVNKEQLKIINDIITDFLNNGGLENE